MLPAFASERVRIGPVLACLLVGQVLGDTIGLAFLLVVLRRCGISIRSFAPLGLSRERLIEGCALGAGLFVINYGTLWLLYAPLLALFPERVSPRLLHAIYVSDASWSTTVIQVVLGVGIVPLYEEIVFRGLLLPKATARWGVRKGVLVVSAVFGLPHLDALGAFVFGITLSILFLSSRDLTSAVVAHAVCNACSTLAAPFASWIERSGDGSIAAFNPELVPIALVSLLVGGFLIARFVTSRARALRQDYEPSS